MKYLLSILIFLIAYCCSYTQDDSLFSSINFERIDIGYDEGLRDIVDIYHIEQDSDGILWLGSIKGLFRFNGYACQNVSHYINKTQSNIIKSQWITAINSDLDSMLWIGTANGLYTLHKQKFTCKRIEFTDEAENPKEANFVRNIRICDSFVLVATRDGAYSIDLESQTVIDRFLTNGQVHNSHNGTSSTCADIIPTSNDNHFVIPSRSGLVKASKIKGTSDTIIYSNSIFPKHYPLQPITTKDKYIVPDYFHGIIEYDLSKLMIIDNVTRHKFNALKSIVHLRGNSYLINQEKKGIGLLNLKTNDLQWLSSTNNKIQEGDFRLEKDRNGYIWLASLGELFKSTLPYGNYKNTICRLDISTITSNSITVWTSLEAEEELVFEEEQRNIGISFSITPGCEDNTISYEYSLDNCPYSPIEKDHLLEIFNLSSGHHTISIQAKSNESIIAETSRLFQIYKPFYKEWWFFLICLGLLFTLVYLLYQYNKRHYIEKQKLKRAYEIKLNQLENEALRSQINPHFIFNTLNSIKYYSIQKTSEETSDFISSFSILIRRTLENSKKSLITLSEEIETLKNYTEIESLRFYKGFKIKFYIDDEVPIEDFLVPPMIVQPFVENAIWHGLMHKSSNRELTVNVLKEGEGIVVQIIDNGIGRAKSASLRKKQSHKSSLGLEITQERMQLINDKTQMHNSIEIIDLFDIERKAAGTQVNIHFKSFVKQ